MKILDYLRGLFNRTPENEDENDNPPSPDEVALALLTGFSASGRFDADPALVGQVWALVPHFYLERENYANKIAPMFFLPVGAIPLDGNPNADFSAQLEAVRQELSQPLRRDDEEWDEDSQTVERFQP